MFLFFFLIKNNKIFQSHDIFWNFNYIIFLFLLQILFPGVRTDTFRQLVSFLYCDDIGLVLPTRCLDLLELANRLCLPRLANLVEKRVVEELTRICTASDNRDVVEHCLRLLEPCKVIIKTISFNFRWLD